MTAALDRVRAVADAVLYEGYLLYPYRASATKNRSRWQFGVLVPPSYAAAGTGEHAASRTECLAEAGPGAGLHLRVRFLQLQVRTIEVPCGDDAGGYRETDTLTTGGRELRPWDEAVPCEVDAVLPLEDLRHGARTVEVTAPGGQEVEQVDGGRVVRTRLPVTAELRCEAEVLPGPYGVIRIRAVLANTSAWDCAGAGRDDALRHSLVAAHTLLAIGGGHFLSLLEPPEWAAGYAAQCVNEHTWPVLVGEPGSRDTVLSSPIILYDHPEIAEESATDFHDGTEIDELLVLRTLTLTDEEKREARATDERAREIVDRVDDLPPEIIERLHGAVRTLRPARRESGEAESEDGGETPITARPDVPWWDPGADASVSPETDSVMVDGRPVRKGSRVVLRPGKRRTDAQDMFLTGRQATVQAVFLDIDGDRYLAVSLDDDPAADLQTAHGRYRYFSPDEIELSPEGAAP